MLNEWITLQIEGTVRKHYYFLSPAVTWWIFIEYFNYFFWQFSFCFIAAFPPYFAFFKRIPQIQTNYFRLPEKKHFYFCYCDGWGSGIAAWSRESNPKWAVNENKKVEFQKIEKFVINVKSIEIDLK